MSDTTDSAVSEQPAGSAPVTAPAHTAEAAASSPPPQPSTQQDFTAHFEALFTHLGKLPEVIIDALREAVPVKEKQAPENQETVVGAQQVAAEPAKGGEETVVSVPSSKRSFGNKWLGR